MLDLPGLAEAQAVGQLDLVERVGEALALISRVPGPRKLVFVKHAELHNRPLLHA